MKCPKLNSQQTPECSVTATDKLYSAAFLELLLFFEQFCVHHKND